MSQTAAIPAGGAATAAGAEPVVGRLLDSRADFTPFGLGLGSRRGAPSMAPLDGQAGGTATIRVAGLEKKDRTGRGSHMTAMRSGRVTARVAGRSGGFPPTGSRQTLQGADRPGVCYLPPAES